MEIKDTVFNKNRDIFFVGMIVSDDDVFHFCRERVVVCVYWIDLSIYLSISHGIGGGGDFYLFVGILLVGLGGGLESGEWAGLV